jgi:hypothetical protein
MVNNNKAFTIVELGVVIVLFLLIDQGIGAVCGECEDKGDAGKVCK